MGFKGDIVPSGERPDIIPDRYIVTLKHYLTASEASAHCSKIQELCSKASTTSTQDAGTTPKSFLTFGIRGGDEVEAASTEGSSSGDSRFHGYATMLTPDMLETVKGSHEVADIEPDRYVYTCEEQRQNLPVFPPGSPWEGAVVWGLYRISHHERFTGSNYEYVYNDEESGEGTTAYVIDTGVRTDHPEFEGRASFGINVIDASSVGDTNGHGTHVAGTIASKTFGVAKKAKIINVKVYPDSTPENPRPSTATSAIIMGLDWAVNDAKSKGIIQKSVANISSGGAKSLIFNQAVGEAVRSGMVVVVAAGNEGADASGGSPSSTPEAITVGATDSSERLAGFSNWGRIVDVLAPGQGILSTWNTDDQGGIMSLSGTSMASPHVAGLACCLRQNPAYPSATSVIQEIRARAEGGISIHSLSILGTPNLIIYNRPAEQTPARMP